MATAFHVFGPCVPQTDTGSANAFEALGVCENGGTVDEEDLVQPIHSDLGGPMSPVEFQQMGIRYTIRMQIIAPDEAVVTKIKILSQGGSADGTPATPGLLLGTNSKKFKLYLPSANVAPWVFQHSRIVRNGIKEGTVAGSYDLTIDAWRFLAGSASSMSGAQATRVAPS